MKFGKYLEDNIRPEWRSKYVRYAHLKRLLHAVEEAPAHEKVVPTELSLTMRRMNSQTTPQETFFIALEQEVHDINEFTQGIATQLRASLRDLLARIQPHLPGPPGGATSTSHKQPAATLPGTSKTGRADGPGRRRTPAAGCWPPSSSAAVGNSAAAANGASKGAAAASSSTAAAGKVSLVLPGSTLGTAGRAMTDAATSPNLPAVLEINGSSSLATSLVSPAGGTSSSPSSRWSDKFLEEARALGEEYLALEKYVNLNYAGFQKILKKHDKVVDEAPCWSFYKMHMSNQPWVRGDHHDIQVSLARIFSLLHRACVPESIKPAPAVAGRRTGPAHQPHQGSTNKYWVKLEDVSHVRHHILQHLPLRPRTRPRGWVPGFDGNGAGPNGDDDDHDYDVHNLLFLDNNSLDLYHALLYGRPYATTLHLSWLGDLIPREVRAHRLIYREGWRPEKFVEDTFPIKASRVAEFLHGRWTWADAAKFLLADKQQQTQQQQRGSSDPHNLGVGADDLSGSGSGGIGGGHDLTVRNDAAMHQVVAEYQLFKAFTEVQRLVESKQLQPVVRTKLRTTVFSTPFDESIVIDLDEDIRCFLEYSHDGATRLANGLWRQEHPADMVHFPYAVMQVHCETDGHPEWLRQLVSCGKLVQVHDFSKFLHGCAALMPDMVRAVPFWIDDPAVQHSLTTPTHLGHHLTVETAQSCTALPELSPGGGAAAAVGVGAGGRSQPPPQPPGPPIRSQSMFVRGSLPVVSHSSQLGVAPGDAAGIPLSAFQALSQEGAGEFEHAGGGGEGREHHHLPHHHHHRSAGGSWSAGHSEAIALQGWQARLVNRLQRGGSTVYGPHVLFVEPDEYMANECILILFLRMAIVISGFATGMLGFAAAAYVDPDEHGSVHISEMTALVLLVSALVLVTYGLGSYLWRNNRFYLRNAGRYDMAVSGPLLSLAVAGVMFALLLLNLVDIYDIMRVRRGGR